MVSKQKYYAWHREEIGFRDYLDYFTDKNPVLDIGCGTGWLGKYHKSIYGVDNDAIAVKSAKKFEKAFYVELSKEKLPFEASFFEGVIAKDIIEHLHDPTEFISDVNKVLKKGGLVFISTKLPSKSFWDDYTHVKHYTRRSLVSLLEDNGFEVRKIWYSGNWPGMGIFFKLFNIRKTPRIFFIMTRLGLNRNNINVIAIKK